MRRRPCRSRRGAAKRKQASFAGPCGGDPRAEAASSSAMRAIRRRRGGDPRAEAACAPARVLSIQKAICAQGRPPGRAFAPWLSRRTGRSRRGRATRHAFALSSARAAFDASSRAGGPFPLPAQTGAGIFRAPRGFLRRGRSLAGPCASPPRPGGFSSFPPPRKAVHARTAPHADPEKTPARGGRHAPIAYRLGGRPPRSRPPRSPVAARGPAHGHGFVVVLECRCG